MNDQQFLLANAYLDGMLDAAELAAAEADPTVMAEVERLRALQLELRTVEPAGDEQRERAIAAALDAFDSRTGLAAAPLAPATVLPFERRRSSSARWLAVAAAVLGIGVLATVVSRSGFGSSDEESSASLDNVDNLPPPQARVAPEAAASTEAAAMENVEAPAATEAPALAAAADAAAPMAATEAPAAAEAPATEAPAAGGTDDGAWFSDRVVGPENLAQVGAELLTASRAEALPSVPPQACRVDPPLVVLAGATYTPTAATGEAPASSLVWIAVDPDNGITLALDAATCEAVQVASP